MAIASSHAWRSAGSAGGAPRRRPDVASGESLVRQLHRALVHGLVALGQGSGEIGVGDPGGSGD